MVEVKLSDGGGYILLLRDGREIYNIHISGRPYDEIQSRINALAWKRWATPEVIDEVRRIARI